MYRFNTDSSHPWSKSREKKRKGSGKKKEVKEKKYSVSRGMTERAKLEKEGKGKKGKKHTSLLPPFSLAKPSSIRLLATKDMQIKLMPPHSRNQLASWLLVH